MLCRYSQRVDDDYTTVLFYIEILDPLRHLKYFETVWTYIDKSNPGKESRLIIERDERVNLTPTIYEEKIIYEGELEDAPAPFLPLLLPCAEFFENYGEELFEMRGPNLFYFTNNGTPFSAANVPELKEVT